MSRIAAYLDDDTTWPLGPAWDAAVHVCALAHRIAPEAIRAESRGRGPKPPSEVRLPKKLAIYLAFSLSGCQYAALARHVGLHKDTVHSHCGDIRDEIATDARLETLVGVLGSAAIAHMEISGIAVAAPCSSLAARLDMRGQVREMQRGLNELCDAACEALSDDTLRTSDPLALHPTRVKNILRVVE
jgi:hypothetical protein